MRRIPGEKAGSLKLPSITGNLVDTGTLAGRPYLLSFLRFASCPFCNLRVHELVRRYDEFGKDFTIVAVFDSPLDNLMHHAAGHHAPFAIVADPDNRCYRAFGVEHSISGVFKGMFLRMPTLLRGMLKGYIPTTIKGSMTTMPADFLIDRAGIIRTAHYGRDEGDHLPFDQIKAFSRQA